MSPESSRRTTRGAALITTLILVSAIALIVVSLFAVNRQEIESTTSNLSKTRADLAEAAAFQDASSLLRSFTDTDHYLITSTTEGSGTDLTRFHYVTVPQSTTLIHTPLFVGGKTDSTSMPNLNQTTTSDLASSAVAKPSLQFTSREAEERIELPPLTHLAENGETFQENRFPTTGFIELDQAASQSLDPRNRNPGARYTYWIEDLEGYPNLDVIGSRTDHHLSENDEPFPDYFRGGYSKDDSRTDLTNGADSGLRLSSAEDPFVIYQFPKAYRGQTRTGQMAPGLSPADSAPVPWATPNLDFDDHPFAQIKKLAGHTIHHPPIASGQTTPETNRFSSGLSPWFQRPMIPYGHDYEDEGIPRHNINELVEASDMSLATIIERNLPAFEDRRGGFPESPADPAIADYTATIAASLIDYADEDDLPSTPTNTINTTGQIFRGVDSYCPVNEFFVEFEYKGYESAGGAYTLTFVARVYAEFWNTLDTPVNMTQAGIDFQFLDIPQFTCFTSTWKLESSDIVKNEPLEVPLPVLSIAPNEIKVESFGEIEWEVSVSNTGGLPIAFPVVENFRAQPAAGNINPRAAYTLEISGAIADGGGRSPAGSDDAHGFFFYRENRLNEGDPIMRVGGSVPRHKAHGSGTNVSGSGHGIQGTTLGDPWMNFYTISTVDNFRFRGSEYRNHASPGSRNLSQSAVPSSREDCFSDQARVRDWPDRGYDNPIGISPTSDSVRPDDPSFIVPTDPRRAPWRLSNEGYYFSVTEFGNIHDPVMWVYGDRTATTLLGGQNYRDTTDRSLLNPYLLSLPNTAEPNPRYGGGNTLRIGRPEHEKFDQPGMRASQLLDLFQSGFSGTNLGAEASSETDLLYENFDPADHRDPPAARNENDAQNAPFSSLYDSSLNALGKFESKWGKLNLNTAPTLFEIEALLRGPLVSSDIVVEQGTEDDPLIPDYTDEGTLGELTKSLDPDAIPLIALGLYKARPFYSPSHLARVLSELIREYDALPDTHNDAEAEETFARVFNTTSFNSRHFRIYTYAETYQTTTGAVLSRASKVYEVFVEPNRDDSGKIESTKLHVLKVSDP